MIFSEGRGRDGVGTGISPSLLSCKFMARKAREFYKGGFWHVFNRGITKEVVFRREDDFRFYLYKVKESLKKFPVAVHAYNLIPNHVHYLIEQNTDVSPGKFIGSVHGSFGLVFNRKYTRAGPLFQDRFKANHIENDEHLLNISFYVNLNKVLEKLQHFDRSLIVSKGDIEKLLEEAEKDAWSSYPVYLGLRDDQITQTKFVLSLLSDDIKKAQQEYRKMAKDFIVSGHFLKTRDLEFEGDGDGVGTGISPSPS